MRQRGLVQDRAWTIAPSCQLELLWDVVSSSGKSFRRKTNQFFGLNQGFRSFCSFPGLEQAFTMTKASFFGDTSLPFLMQAFVSKTTASGWHRSIGSSSSSRN